MYYCTNCGKESKAKICSHCGVKNNRVHNYCSWCGEKLNEHADMCPNCKEKVKLGCLPTVASVLAIPWFILNVVLFWGFAFIEHEALIAILFLVVAIASIPFVGRIITRKTHTNKRKNLIRLGIVLLRIVLAVSLFFVATDIAMSKENEPPQKSLLSSYTYDEYVMYSTMTKGYALVLDSLKNPKSAEFMGISYSPDANVAYYCVIAENDFGGNTKSYIRYSAKYDNIYEDDSLKYYYDTAEIKRSFDDLFAFMKAAETADESDVPTQGRNEAFEAYTKSEQKIYDLLIRGTGALDSRYSNLFIFGYKYSTDRDEAYFFFTAEINGSPFGSYASYSNTVGLVVADDYKTLYEEADVEKYAFEIEDYQEAKNKKDISK